jgi:pilus assembly protein CpaB
MNTRRLVVLLLAAVAAGAVALLVRGFFGGGTKEANATPNPSVVMKEVLVASVRLEPGFPVAPDQVRWQAWPAASVDPSFILKNGNPSTASTVEGTVVRAPIVPGEPVTYTKIIKSDSAGFMAATLAPGMRAVAISVSMASIAGGFIQANDRVDIILTVITNDSPKRGTTRTALSNVRVLAIDQAADNKDQKAVSDVKTVTLELTPQQAQVVTLAQAMGTLSLALRSLGDNEAVASASGARRGAGSEGADDETGFVSVIRYGRTQRQAGGGGQ